MPRNSTWQRLMIRAATSNRIKRVVTAAGNTIGVGRRFAGRTNVSEAIAVANQLRSRGFSSSLFYLGEYARNASIVEETVGQSIAAAHALGAAELDVHVSIDPTSVGYSLDDALGMNNAYRIGNVIAASAHAGRHCMMVDMEDYSLLEKTLTLERALAAKKIPVAVTLQAYLHRTANDLSAIIRRAGYVLLVKGAFAEREPFAWQSRSDIDESYIKLAKQMLSTDARETGFYPAFGTHDERLIRAIQAAARAQRWTPGTYEFEFLYGVNMRLAAQLVTEGESVRLYLPFGRDWWPYVARRIGESPSYLKFLIRTLIHSN